MASRMVIVAAADIMCHVMTVIMLDPIHVIVAHRATMLRQNGMSVIASCRAIMAVGVQMAQLDLQVRLDQALLGQRERQEQQVVQEQQALQAK